MYPFKVKKYKLVYLNASQAPLAYSLTIFPYFTELICHGGCLLLPLVRWLRGGQNLCPDRLPAMPEGYEHIRCKVFHRLPGFVCLGMLYPITIRLKYKSQFTATVDFYVVNFLRFSVQLSPTSWCWCSSSKLSPELKNCVCQEESDCQGPRVLNQSNPVTVPITPPHSTAISNIIEQL